MTISSDSLYRVQTDVNLSEVSVLTTKPFGILRSFTNSEYFPSIHTLFPKSVKMKELVRDTVLGHFLRLLTGGRVFPYEEDRDPSLWKRYIDVEKSGRMAHHGHTEDEEEDEEEADSTQQQQRASGVEGNATANTRDSSDTEVGSGEVQRNEVSGHPIDPEKGRDVSIVTWFGDDDPEVCSSSARSSCTICSTSRRIL